MNCTPFHTSSLHPLFSSSSLSSRFIKLLFHRLYSENRLAPWVARVLLTLTISKSCLLLTNSIQAELAIAVLIAVYLGPFFHRSGESKWMILRSVGVVTCIDVLTFPSLVNYFSVYTSLQSAIILTLLIILASYVALFAVFTTNTPIETATLLRRIIVLLIVVGFIIIIMNPDLTILLRDFDFFNSEISFIHPLSALSIAIILLCCMMLHVLPTTYTCQLVTVLCISASLSVFVTFSYYPINQVLYLLVHLLFAVYCILLLHSDYSLHSPSQLTLTVGKTIPFL